jgi:hypothetical protein
VWFVSVVHHGACEGVIVTHIGHAELTVRAEPPVDPDGRTVILVRIEAPMLDGLAAAYLDPTEALALAESLRRAADAVCRQDGRGRAPRSRPGVPAVAPPPQR